MVQGWLAMTLEEILERIELDQAQHMTGGPAAEQEIAELEGRLSRPLPASYRAFLSRLGAGIFYQQHEIFGSRRVMIHDIELVPDVVSMQRQLERDEPRLRQGQLPLHRAGGILHLIDLNPGADCGRVVRAEDQVGYPDLATFLEAIVLP